MRLSDDIARVYATGREQDGEPALSVSPPAAAGSWAAAGLLVLVVVGAGVALVVTKLYPGWQAATELAGAYVLVAVAWVSIARYVRRRREDIAAWTIPPEILHTELSSLVFRAPEGRDSPFFADPLAAAPLPADPLAATPLRDDPLAFAPLPADPLAPDAAFAAADRIEEEVAVATFVTVPAPPAEAADPPADTPALDERGSAPRFSSLRGTPLIVLGSALALGVIIGLAVPQTAARRRGSTRPGRTTGSSADPFEHDGTDVLLAADPAPAAAVAAEAEAGSQAEAVAVESEPVPPAMPQPKPAAATEPPPAPAVVDPAAVLEPAVVEEDGSPESVPNANGARVARRSEPRRRILRPRTGPDADEGPAEGA